MFKKLLLSSIALYCFEIHAANEPLHFEMLEPMGTVFYLRIFDGYLPLPNRYILMAPKESNTEIKFHNAGATPPTNLRRPSSAASYGAISLGQREQCSICNDGSTEERLFEKVERYAWKHLEIKVCHQTNSLSTVYIFDDESYLYIFDADDKLWKKMLSNFSYQPVERDKPLNK
jgi:hypothetical protein